LPYAQSNHYMNHSDTTRVMRDLHAQGKLQGERAVWMSDSKPAEELYDRALDPDNVRNLATDPAHRATLDRLRAALDAHLSEVSDMGAEPEQKWIDAGHVTPMVH